MAHTTSDRLFNQLKKIINLPDNVISLKLSVGYKTEPIVEIESYVDGKVLTEIVTERFELKRIDDETSHNKDSD